jgi:PEGA domain-containing protein
MTTQYRVIIVICVALLVLVRGERRIVSAGDAPGSLLVESDPAGASVYVDGRLAGETPLTLQAIAVGVHRVQLARAGYLENSRLVMVKERARARVRTQLTAAAPPLKIVIVEGEGAVNIIQQKTAVAPVIEVRDRNDQPVSGALVRFAIQKGRASFNGVRTLTTTTDAFGRATATGLTPTGSGALQIGTTAAFQGQTTAITIAQTNVLTAAQASAAAGGGSGTAGGGGGLSHLAIAGIVGGAGAGIGGALIASKLGANESDACRASPVCGGWRVVFTPGLDVSPCGVTTTAGVASQNLNVDASGTFRETWGNALGSPSAVVILEASGTMTATGLSGTLRCLATPATGTISASPAAGDYLGSVTLSGTTVSIRIVRRSPGEP